MNAATRAVIERLVEALVPFCDEGEDQPSLNSNQLDAVLAEARALLEEPASEDAWIKDADTYAEALGLAYYLATLAKDSFTSGFSTDQELLDAQKNVANHKQRLFAHLRARPAPEGFVSVPVEPTEAMIAAYLKDQPSGEA